jgi:hypothetical protein
MKYVACVALLLVAITAMAFAASPTSEPNVADESPIPGRFIISKELGAAPALLDTGTGDIWILEDSTNVADARMQAWVPMERFQNAEEVERWRLRAKDKYESVIGSMKERVLSSLAEKAKDLGPDHPEVLALSEKIRKNPELNVSDHEVEAARKAQ